jgi:HD-like signal output (HDOD) protein
VLAAVLHPARVPTVPAVAVRVAEAASRPDCQTDELVALLKQDPGLCAELLRAVNSAQNGLTRPAGSIERAILLVGLNRVRCLALGLSLPSLRPTSRFDPAATQHSLASVGGAILARELAVRAGHPSPDDDLMAGLLRDVGVLLLQQTFPAAWAELTRRPADPLGDEQCAREREAIGVDHAEVGAEVLRKWGLPDDVVEPIRHHHHPEQLAGTPHAARAEVLWFAGLLTRLEAVVEHPEALDRILAVAESRFALPRAELADFLEAVRPKIDDFAQLVNRDIGHCPNYGAILSAARAELSRLAATPA